MVSFAIDKTLLCNCHNEIEKLKKDIEDREELVCEYYYEFGL